MSLSRRVFLSLMLCVCVLTLASCNYTGPVAKSKSAPTEPANDDPLTSPPVPKPTAEPGIDPLADPALPVVPPNTRTAPEDDPKVRFDPTRLKDPTKTKAAFEAPALPKGAATSEQPVVEQDVPRLPIPKAGVEEPTLKPQLLALTWVGGKGNQWIQEVGFLSDGRIYGKSGGGTFTVYYAPDGKKLSVEGDVDKPCTGPRGPNLNTRGSHPFRATDPQSKVKLEIGYETFGGLKAQPFLRSSADWKWWGWEASDMGKKMEASARGVRVHWLQDDRFLAKVFVEGGNCTVQKDPRKLKEENTALSTAMLRDPGGPGTLYITGNLKSGIPGLATFVKGKALAEVIDPWERLYVGMPIDSKNSPDALKLGGAAGFGIINANLTNCIYSATVGADNIYSMALKDNILVLGGNIGMAMELDPKVKTKNIPPAKLPIKNPAQQLPGGDEDGFLAIINLW